jgi:hypothetical protein
MTGSQPISLGERVERYIAACPRAISGQGGHNQTFAVACALVNGFALNCEQALAFLQRYNQKCKPEWSQAELEHKIESAACAKHNRPRGDLINHRGDPQYDCCEPVPINRLATTAPDQRKASSKWPGARFLKIQKIVKAGAGLADLIERSPRRFDDTEPHAEEIVDVLFPGNPLLCAGRSRSAFATRRREVWRGRLAELSLIVPNPMLALKGLTKEGKESEHTLRATAHQVYQVIEFDFTVKTRRGQSDSVWAPLVRNWQAGEIEIVDACAALHMHLASRAPLVLVTHSGGKSLHGWYRVFELLLAERLEFMRYAVSLGADRATWVRNQFVRVPDGRRENGARQVCYYFNPQESIGL